MDESFWNANSARHPRDSVMLSGTVERFEGSAPTRHRVRDLSPGGVRIDQAADLHVGATILLTIGALEAIPATVVWIKSGSAGLSFARAINPDDARAKTANAPRPAGGRQQQMTLSAPVVPRAGWIDKLRNPYQK